MMRQEDAQALGIVSLSDLAAYMAANPAELMVGIDHEFSARPDGWPELIKVYGIDIPEENVSIMDLGITYKALRDGQVDVAMGFATDGRIAAFDLVNLEDDNTSSPSTILAGGADGNPENTRRSPISWATSGPASTPKR